jgi:hypothetical protein
MDARAHRDDNRLQKVPSVDCAAILEYGVGVFFKSAVHTWRFEDGTSSHIDLGPERTEALRKFVHRDARFPDDMALTVCLSSKAKQFLGVIPPLEMQPQGTEERRYYFHVSGVYYCLLVGRSIDPKMRMIAFNNAGSIRPILIGDEWAFVMENERALKSLFPEALPLDSLRTKGDVQRVIGKLVQFQGYFRSKNAPRLRKDGSVPIAHAIGDIDRDHIVYKDYRRFRLVLPLEPLWFASHSSVAFFRRRIPIRGLARVHSVSRHVVVASPVWLALPSGPLSQQQ